MSTCELRYVIDRVGHSTQVARKRIIFGGDPKVGETIQNRGLFFIISSIEKKSEKGFDIELVTVCASVEVEKERLTREEFKKNGWIIEEEIIPAFNCIK